jgi:hypothetical protein
MTCFLEEATLVAQRVQTAHTQNNPTGGTSLLGGYTQGVSEKK